MNLDSLKIFTHNVKSWALTFIVEEMESSFWKSYDSLIYKIAICYKF